LPEARYLDALRADLEAALPRSGAGACSASSSAAARPACSRRRHRPLLADIRARLPLEPGCEITLEANPGTFERDRSGLPRRRRHAAVDRRAELRRRAAAGASAACTTPRRRAPRSRGGRTFDTFNLDLMYALPGQDLAALRADLDQALASRRRTCRSTT
jgi:hypothetical protein